MNYSSSLPYPEIKVEKQNPYYASLLLEDYSGVNSEYTSISEYIYNHIEKSDTLKNVSEAFKKIAIVEMKHLNILGKLILKLGIDPKFKTKTNDYYTPWNSSLIDYNKDITYILLNSIRIEKIAIANYEFHINIIKDKYIQEILKRIILDEKEHIECFKELLKDFI